MFPDNFVKVLPTSGSITNLSGSEPVMLRNKKRCRVLFSYQPLHEDELELTADQVIEFLGEVEDGWWKGRTAGRVGVFPSNFVEMCTESDRDKVSKSVEERNRKNSQRTNVVNEKYESVDSTKKEPQEAGGDNKQSPAKDDERKMSASQRSQIGPESPAPDTAPRLPPKPVKDQCLVLFPYTAQNEDELSLLEGQLITVITKDCEDKGWWKGELDGKVGVFPDNFVKRVSQHLSSAETHEQVNASSIVPDSPEKPKFMSLKASPSRDNIKKLFENSGPSSVLSKATSYEKLKEEKQEQNTKLAFSQKDEKKVDNEKASSSKPISDLNKKVANLKNELSKNELFNKPLNKVESPVKATPSRSSLDSVLSDKANKETESKRRTSEPAAELRDLAPSKLSHPTASWVKAPKRRPPSQHFLKENIPDDLPNDPEVSESSSEIHKVAEQTEKVVETEEVSNKTKVLENPVNKPIGAIQVMPTKPSGISSDSKPSWMEEFSRKKANRKSGIFAEKQDSSPEELPKPVPKASEIKPDKPAPPKADTKPSIASKPDSDISEIRKSFSRDKILPFVEPKVESIKQKTEDDAVIKRQDSAKSERVTRPSLPASLSSSGVRPVSGASEVKRSSDIVRHSSEVTKSAGAGERRGQDLARKHSDSSRHSDKLAPAVHSTNLGNPDKLSFAKPERPVMSKNDRNSAKNETALQEAASEKQSSEGSVIGWKSEIISNNRVSDILACKESNGVLSKEKENISGPCKEVSL